MSFSPKKAARFLALFAAALILKAQAPVIAPGGVIGAGLSAPSQQLLSPGAIFAIFGTNFAPAGTSATPGPLVNGALPTNLGGACVEVNGVRAPLFAVFPTQINAQAPLSPQDTSASITVIAECDGASPVTSNAAYVLAGPASPEFFYLQFGAAGGNPVAAYNAVSGALIGPGDSSLPFSTTPANAGDIVVLYATGLGATSPPTPVGGLATGASQLASPLGIALGGEPVDPADILYAGTAPGFAGLYQINLQIPSDAPAGPQPLALSVGNSSSPPSAVLSIAAGGCELPQIQSFTAFPSQLNAPGSTQIAWFVDGASAVSFQPAIGSTAVSGSVAQTFSAASSIQLTATNTCGTSVQTLNVGVGAPAASTVTNANGQPVTSAFVGDILGISFQNLGDPSTIANILYQTPDGTQYAYPPLSMDSSGRVYFAMQIFPGMTYSAPLPIQISAITITGQTIATNVTLNVSLPTYAGDAVQDFTSYVNGMAGSYSNALGGFGAATGNTQAAGIMMTAVMAYIGPLQSAAAQIAATGSAQIPTYPSGASVTITAQDLGLFLALLNKTSNITPPGVLFPNVRGALSTRASNADQCAALGIKANVPLISQCQVLQGLAEDLETFCKYLPSVSTVAAAVVAIGIYGTELAFPTTLVVGGPMLIGMTLGLTALAAEAFCYAQPIWLQQLTLLPPNIPNASASTNATPSTVDIEANLNWRLGDVVLSAGQAILEVASDITLGPALEAYVEKTAGGGPLVSSALDAAVGQIESAFNNLIGQLIPDLSPPNLKLYKVGRCANDLTNADFPFPLVLQASGAGSGYNDFLLTGEVSGTGNVVITGNSHNFLFVRKNFACGVPGPDTFTCTPVITVGPVTYGVFIDTATAEAGSCDGSTIANNPAFAYNTQNIGFSPFNVSAASEPESAALTVSQSSSNIWNFAVSANLAILPESACSAPPVNPIGALDVAFSELTVGLMLPAGSTVSVSASGCDNGVPSGFGYLAALYSGDGYAPGVSGDQALLADGSATWMTQGQQELDIAVGSALDTPAGQANEVPETCQVTGTILSSSPIRTPTAPDMRRPVSGPPR
jgi:uncharacterized protein (TIGR03437 family)